MYENRPRGHNCPHVPDIKYYGDLKNADELKKFCIVNFK